ncbi:hypothetical protein [Paraburkholderia aspalathi]|uniref:Uncharacterized protein n=1 Tax=Paraburkholderia aspalathi TaxID=1324617 RepID=A0A1I7ER76_9BURK|nr:hypothetical protein [Paraburkholderia aspalathi]SFU26424.1 hypothetical protein SAMN05192563_105433 [Paraburkholderia aspalathi]
MSLLFVSCRGLKKLDGAVGDDFPGLTERDVLEIPVESEWPRFIEGLEVGAVYQFAEDCYYSVAHNIYQFSDRIDKLADLVRYDYRRSDAGEPGPFRELFQFSGFTVYGPVACAKLAADFAIWEPLAKARPLGNGDESFYENYELLREMFEFAAEDGAVWAASM